MATLKQIKIIEIIQKERSVAKEAKLNVATQLSGGYSKYKTAINVMICVGALAVVFACLKLALDVYNIAVFFAIGGQLDTAGWLSVIFELTICVVTLIIGAKLYKLNATPTFILVSLIIMLVCNLFVFGGIIPWLIVALSVVGIVCWGTYRNWFNDIKIPGKKKGKNNGHRARA